MNEIYKGMDNSAEQINENFTELSSQIESGEGSGYRWVKLPTGMIIYHGIKDVDFSQQSIRVSVAEAPFTSMGMAVSVTTRAWDSGLADQLKTVHVLPSTTEDFALEKTTATSITGVKRIIFTAIGV